MLAALELNDQSLLMQAEDGAIHAEPGFARLAPGGIVSGEEARAMAWRQPQHIYNQYWCHLNQTPLAARENWARHHGDIAFAQLGNLWKGAGRPDSLLILAPGSFADDQLSLLLGMAGALPAKVRLLVDSALAACLQVERDTLHVDMHLHQTVLTLVRPEGGSVRITDQEVFPALGIMQIQNSLARHVSNLMIESFRYDPLHASESEQDIHDRIPAWLTHLSWEDEISATLDSEHGQLPFILRKDDVKKLVGERTAQLQTFLGRHRGSSLLLSHASGFLAGLSDEFRGAEVASLSAPTGHILSHYPLMVEQDEGLYRVQQVERAQVSAQPAVTTHRLATHVLHDDRALPLSRPVSIHLEEQGVRLASELDDAAAMTVILRNRSLEELSRATDLEVRLPADCSPGESIVVAGHQLRLIEVADG